MTKKKVLWLSGVGSTLFVLFVVALMNNYCGVFYSFCRKFYGFSVYFIFPLPSVFLFSLITYRMKEEVFQAWWNFACWFIPIIIIVTFLLNMQSGGGGLGIGGAVSEAFDFLILSVLYLVFILVSFIRIILAYRRTR